MNIIIAIGIHGEVAVIQQDESEDMHGWREALSDCMYNGELIDTTGFEPGLYSAEYYCHATPTYEGEPDIEEGVKNVKLIKNTGGF